MRFLTIVAAAAALLPIAAFPAPAQEAPRPTGRVMVSPGLNRMMEYYVNRRGRLGLVIDTRAGATDTIGARVEAVTPGGPAALAGLRSGDIITAMNGARLTVTERGGPFLRSMPGLKLIELAARLSPGDTVNLVYQRGTGRRTTSLVTDEDPAFTYGFMFPLDSGTEPAMGVRESLPAPYMNEGPLHSFFRFGMSDLELAPINPRLGRYFGVQEGILVVQVPEDSRLNLEPGDVVLSLDGRKATSPAHMLRILRSYQNGEPVTLELVRMKQRLTVTGQP